MDKFILEYLISCSNIHYHIVGGGGGGGRGGGGGSGYHMVENIVFLKLPVVFFWLWKSAK